MLPENSVVRWAQESIEWSSKVLPSSVDSEDKHQGANSSSTLRLAKLLNAERSAQARADVVRAWAADAASRTPSLSSAAFLFALLLDADSLLLPSRSFLAASGRSGKLPLLSAVQTVLGKQVNGLQPERKTAL